MLNSLYVPPNTIAPYLDTKKASSNHHITRRRWAKIAATEFFYSKALRNVARTVGRFIIDLWQSGKRDYIPETLEKYSDIIEPWADSVARKMIADVSLNDHKAWIAHSGKMAQHMQTELRTMPQGQIVQELRNRQVSLIKSLPLEAAQRVQNLAFEAATVTGKRWEEVTKQIMNSEQVTESRARCIARTEVTRSQAIIQEARARWIGSDTYIWHTLRDRKVREDHKELEGQVFNWDDPPVVSKRQNIRAHPGCWVNCRCYAEPIMPARFQIGNRKSNA